MKLRELLERDRQWLGASQRRPIGAVGVALGVTVAGIAVPLYFAGHSSLQVTMGPDGHLFRSEDRKRAIAESAKEMLT
jgi:hypothetical protein